MCLMSVVIAVNRKQNIAMCDNLYERYDKAVVILVVNTTELRHWD